MIRLSAMKPPNTTETSRRVLAFSVSLLPVPAALIYEEHDIE
jgi:hypothetical protein